MSRIGKRPIEIPKGVQVTLKDGVVAVKGAKNSLEFRVPHWIDVVVQEGKVLVTRQNDSREARSCHGVAQSIIQNMILGVTVGFKKELEIKGVGYRADVKGKDLQLSLGFSHPILYSIPEGIQIKVANQTSLEISGHDKVLVGQIAAKLRRLRPPEPYQGKGVRYKDEVIRRKVGKAAAGATGA